MMRDVILSEAKNLAPSKAARCFASLSMTCLALVGLMGCRQGSASSPAKAQPRQIVTASGIEMISLPGGQFLMGNSSGNPDEAPPHKVTVSPFLMDKVEV